MLAGAAIYLALPDAFTIGTRYLSPAIVTIALVGLKSYSMYRAED